MSGLSSQGEAAVLAAIAATAYVSLHTADPGDTGANEVSGAAYARQGPVAFVNSGNNPTVAANSAIVSFPTATAPQGTITHFGVWTAASAGVYQGGGALDAPKPVASGDQVRFLTGALTLAAD
ncbi:MAG TPA: hypothetical protein VFW22_07840 [Pseudolabrys sp.]|nr:hypothetical protein [Pseudolabrys sp.]